MTAFSYQLIAQSGNARRGRLFTAHGPVETPTFMAVGTAATVKAMTMDAVKSTGTQIVLGNTYHLMLRPSAERIAALGGLHKFMNWQGPILTDSGGYQVMSLGALRKITEQGVTFRSHIDGRAYELSPERSTEIQHLLDATITMAFDECPALPATEETCASRWNYRCAGPNARARPLSRVRAMRSLVSIKAACCHICALNRQRNLPISALKAMPWVAWPWASRSMKCLPCWMKYAPRYPPISRAT
jgi:hypothetical protein